MENPKWRTDDVDGNQMRPLASDRDLLKPFESKGSGMVNPGRWTIWYRSQEETDRKTLVLDGNKFSTLDGFYREIDRLFRGNSVRGISYNLSVLHEVLHGGSPVLKLREPVRLVWKNSAKSTMDLGLRPRNRWAVSESFFEILIGIIYEHKHIELCFE